jgi:hypothetical protein
MNTLSTTVYCALSGLDALPRLDTQGSALGYSYLGPSDLT